LAFALTGGTFADYLSDYGIGSTENGLGASPTSEDPDLPVYRDDPPLVKIYKSGEVIGTARVSPGVTRIPKYATGSADQGVTSSTDAPLDPVNSVPSTATSFYQPVSDVAPPVPKVRKYSSFTTGTAAVANSAAYPASWAHQSVSTRESASGSNSFRSSQSSAAFLRSHQTHSYTNGASSGSGLTKYGSYNSAPPSFSSAYQTPSAGPRIEGVSSVTKVDPFHSTHHTTVHYAQPSGARSSALYASAQVPFYGVGAYSSPYGQGIATYGYNYAQTLDVRSYRNFLRKKCKSRLITF
ncbi:unnamed protein product, partial [Ixodes hexagonus]